MFRKPRGSEDSQMMTQHILNGIEERRQRFNCAVGLPSLTVIAKPVFPDRRVISTAEILAALPGPLNHSQEVVNGVCTFPWTSRSEYKEFNEYGIAYCKRVLNCSENKEIEYLDLRDPIAGFLPEVSTFYKFSESLGNIEVSVGLKAVFDTRLKDNQRRWVFQGEARCLESDVFVAVPCLPDDFSDPDKRKRVCEALICQLLSAFHVRSYEPQIREKVRKSFARL